MNDTITLAAVQSEPVWFDLDATVAKTIDLIGQAARAGAEVIAFPETWLPGYPTFIWLGDDEYKSRFRERYVANSLIAGSPQHRSIENAAADNHISVVLGLSEREGEKIFMGLFFISPDGQTLLRRRKVKPSGPEWDLFTSGDGDDVVVVETPIGRIGGLNCSENRRPLLRHALLSQGEQIHVAAWPHFGIHPDERQMTADTSMTSTRQYAAEGGVVTLGPTHVATKRYLDALEVPDGDEHLVLTGRGAARIFGPEGEDLAVPLGEHVDGILYATILRSMIESAPSYDAYPLDPTR